MINYHLRKFRPIVTSMNGQADSSTIFRYEQKDAIITASYEGHKVLSGQIIGIIDENGVIDMRYQQISRNGEIKTGKCIATPEILPSGKIRLHEKWQWTSGDFSEGESILEEI